MNKQFAKLKVYELGGGVAFSEETATVPFLVLPKGQATMKPWGASGFVFENVITGDVIAFVDTLDDVLDSAGVVYGITQIAVMTAVSAFFFELSGAAAVDVTYDNAVSGLAATDVQAAIDELAAGGGGYPIAYPVGYHTNFNVCSNTQGTNFVAPNYYYGAIVDILHDVDIQAPRVRVSGAIAGNGIVALYKFNGTQWVLVDQTGAFNTAVGGVAVLAWSTGTLSLTPGVYCFCTNTSAGNGFETITSPGLSNYFGMANTMAAISLSLQLHPSAYTGTALATMPMALSSAGFVPNIINLIA